jgi:hypothetical protein
MFIVQQLVVSLAQPIRSSQPISKLASHIAFLTWMLSDEGTHSNTPLNPLNHMTHTSWMNKVTQSNVFVEVPEMLIS